MQLKIFSCRQLIVEHRIFNNAAHALQHFIGTVSQALAEKFNISRCRLHQIGDHFHHRGFARSVGSQEPVDFALLDAHIHAFNSLFALILLG
ncbi:hypothetical protein D3C85_1552060 [compost metagenome]